MAAPRVGGYHVGLPTTCLDRAPASRAGEPPGGPPRSRAARARRGQPRAARGSAGPVTSQGRPARREPWGQPRTGKGARARAPGRSRGAGSRGLTLTGRPNGSTEHGGHGARPTRTPSLGCAGVTQESSQTPPAALYKAKHSPGSSLGSLRLGGRGPQPRTCRRPPTLTSWPQIGEGAGRSGAGVQSQGPGLDPAPRGEGRGARTCHACCIRGRTSHGSRGRRLHSHSPVLREPLPEHGDGALGCHSQTRSP